MAGVSDGASAPCQLTHTPRADGLLLALHLHGCGPGGVRLGGSPQGRFALAPG